jgi:hypothetical protein
MHLSNGWLLNQPAGLLSIISFHVDDSFQQPEPMTRGRLATEPRK